MARALNSLSTAAISARPTPSSSGRSGESSPSIFGSRSPRGWEDGLTGRCAKAVKFPRSLTRPGRRRTEPGGVFVEAGRRRGGIARATYRGHGTPFQALAWGSIFQAGPILADRGPPRTRPVTRPPRPFVLDVGGREVPAHDTSEGGQIMNRWTLMVAAGIVLGAVGMTAARHDEEHEPFRRLSVREIAEKLNVNETIATA